MTAYFHRVLVACEEQIDLVEIEERLELGTELNRDREVATAWHLRGILRAE